jgi:hypothetical protein
VLEKLITFEPESADLEDGGDHKPDADDEQDGPPYSRKLHFPLCSPQSSGPFPSISTSLSPFGCLRSRNASTMSGARQVSGRSRQT